MLNCAINAAVNTAASAPTPHELDLSKDASLYVNLSVLLGSRGHVSNLHHGGTHVDSHDESLRTPRILM